MAWIDDLKMRAEQSLDNMGKDIQGYIEGRVTDAVVKVGQPASGNLTEAQIAAGMRGGPNPTAGPASMVEQASSNIMKWLPLGLVIFGAWFLMKKARR